MAGLWIERVSVRHDSALAYSYQGRGVNRVMVYVVLVALLGASVVLAGCRRELMLLTGDWPKETVMQPGMQITAMNQAGTITITAEEGTRRTYAWDGHERTVKLMPRTKRWYGLLGIYSPGAGWSSGPIRIVTQEGQLHVDGVEEALQWFAVEPSMDWVFSSSGLAVGFLRAPNRHQINVDVIQVFIDGGKPAAFPGADPEAIQVH